jgi:hypothetical protein
VSTVTVAVLHGEVGPAVSAALVLSPPLVVVFEGSTVELDPEDPLVGGGSSGMHAPGDSDALGERAHPLSQRPLFSG